jgi:hypothetical protein
VPIGSPIANTSVFVLDPWGGRLPVGAWGELHIGGLGVARGYHNREDLTAERFVSRSGLGRLYATGDVVRVRHDGALDFAGRSDHQVKIRGHRIEIGEIETVLSGHPAVEQAVVVARHADDETRLVGFVVPTAGLHPTSDELRRHVGSTLPDAMVPSAVHTVEALPLTPNGKVDRNALIAEIPQATEAPAVIDPGAADAERLVAGIWQSELERTVGLDDNFFEIGGHSLLAVKVFRRLAEATGADLALTDVFRYPTVRSFASYLTSIGRSDAPFEDRPPSGTDRGSLRRRALARRSDVPVKG